VSQSVNASLLRSGMDPKLLERRESRLGCRCLARTLSTRRRAGSPAGRNNRSIAHNLL
jgi:hypothetical protein